MYDRDTFSRIGPLPRVRIPAPGVAGNIGGPHSPSSNAEAAIERPNGGPPPTPNSDPLPPKRNPADNLTRLARTRGGYMSAAVQSRDARGRFIGRAKP